MKNAFDGITSRLDTAEKRISAPEVNRNFQNQNAKRKKKKTLEE